MPPAAPGPILESLTALFRLLRWAGLLVALAILGSSVTVVQPDEVAVRLRFGKLTGATAADRVHGPGLLVSLPYLIDEVVRVPVRRVQELPIDALRSRQNTSADRMDLTHEGYALTGERTIVQLAAILKYQISDPVAWALRIVTPDALLHDAVVSALARTLAEMEVDAVLVARKTELAITALTRAQERLDRDGHWVRLVALEFTALRPPQQVASAFDDVQSAFVEKKTRVDEARGYRAQRLPEAAADAQRLIRDAEAAEAAELATARGAAATFVAIHTEYRRNPTVVRQRLYREAIESILAAVGSRVVVPLGSDAGRILIPGDDGAGPWEEPAVR